jgi:hypothetical protein
LPIRRVTPIRRYEHSGYTAQTPHPKQRILYGKTDDWSSASQLAYGCSSWGRFVDG